MKKFQILGVALIAIFAFSVVAATASAVEFLLAEWLWEGKPITAALAVEMEGELLLEDTKTLIGKVDILCSGVFLGTVGPSSADEITELLTLGLVAIPLTALSGTGLECENSEHCEKAKVWAEELPWKTEAELMVDGTETFFVDLLLLGKYYAECTVLGTKIEDLCSAPTVAVKLTNEAAGTVDAEFSDAFQELAGLVLGECTQGGKESAIVEGLATILHTTGGALAVSSE